MEPKTRGGGDCMITTNLLFCVNHHYNGDYCGVEHSHPCYEIVYYCEGEGEVTFSKKKYHFSKDTFMVCPPDVKHIERGNRGTEVLYIGFELYSDFMLPEGVFREEDFGIREYLEKIYYEMKHWSAYAERLINLFCTVIAIRLVNRSETDESAAIGYNFNNIVGYITANYREDISVRKLAEIAGYSYDYFRKAFYKRFGVTVNDFILQKRIEKANEMLESGAFLIKEVAAECGFSSVAQFCTKYRQVTGSTPKQKKRKGEQGAKDLEIDKFSD